MGLILWRSLSIASIIYALQGGKETVCFLLIQTTSPDVDQLYPLTCSQQQYPSQLYQSEGRPEFPQHCALNWKIKLHKIRIKKLRKSEQQ